MTKRQLEMEERAQRIALYIVTENATVRAAETHFGISKSTIHKDLVDRLPSIDGELAQKARAVLDANLADRHNRGGRATALLHSRNTHI